MKILSKTKIIVLSVLLIVAMTLGFVLMNNGTNDASAAVYGFKTTDSVGSVISSSGDEKCPLKIKFSGGTDNSNYIASVKTANLANFELTFDFSLSQLSGSDSMRTPWAYMYFASSQVSSANTKSTWISFSVDSNSGDIRVHFLENNITTDSGCNLVAAIIASKVNPVITVKTSIVGSDITFSFENNGSGSYSTSCPLTTFMEATRCNFDPNDCYICIGNRFADGANMALTSEFMISDPFAVEPSDQSLKSSAVNEFLIGGSMTLSAKEDKVYFEAPANNADNSAFSSVDKYHVNTFNWTLNITEGFAANGSEIYFALRRYKGTWDLQSEITQNNDGLYLIIKRTANNKLSFSVYFYKQDSEASSFTNHQRGNIVKDVPYDPTAQKIEVKIERDASLDYFNVSVNGKAFTENLTVNEFKATFGGTTVSDIKGYLLVQVNSKNAKLAGNMLYVIPESTVEVA